MSTPQYPTSFMFHGSSHNTFNNSTFVIKSPDRIAAFDKLERATSPSAFHSFVGRPQPGKCYPNTRVALLDGLEKWAMGMELLENLTEADLTVESGDAIEVQPCNLPIVWLNGGAGAGKSAVAQTFAERCVNMGHIVASFFFFNTDSTRNSGNRLVASLAYQIAREDTATRAHIEAIVHRDPHIFDQDFKTQILSLIIHPLQKSAQTPSSKENRRSCTVIIDGLDECTGGKVQASIIYAISAALRAGSPDLDKRLPRFLICSRSEEVIAHVFRSSDLQGMFIAMNLSRNSSTNDDIYTFLKGKFDDIKKTHSRADLIPATWPSSRSLSHLQYCSSGHFIYADTVMKFVSTSVRPVNALEIILGLRASPQRTHEPFAELDVLYHHILSRAVDKSNIVNIRHVFGLLAFKYSLAPFFHPDILEKFFGLQDGELDDLLGVTPSLVAVRRFEGTGGVRLHHKSFGDFLHDETRAGRFYIGEDAVRAYAWARCCHMISNAFNLEDETCKWVTTTILVCNVAPDFVLGKKSHSLHEMTQRREASAFVRQYGRSETIGLPSFAAQSLQYFVSLFDILGNCEDSDKWIHQVTGDMICIINDLIYLQRSRLRIQDIYPDLALIICPPTRRYTQRPRAETSLLLSCFEKWTMMPGFQNSQLALVRKIFEDERMGDSRLNEEHYVEACLFLVARLSNAVNFFTPQSVHVVQNQRLLIMNQAARRLLTPFRWRKIARIIRPFMKKGRAYFLHNRQLFDVGRMDMGPDVKISLTRRQLHFGSRSKLVLEKRRDSTLSLEERSLVPFSWGGRRAIVYSGRRITVRGYIMVSDRDHRLAFLPFREINATFFDGNFGALHSERARRRLYASMLADLPDMLAKSSKSDAVAALRFKTFAPLAKRFPELVKRARRAMEEYAIKHGYPAIDGCFGNPLQIASVRNVDQEIDIPPPVAGHSSQGDAIDVVGVAINTNTCLFIIWIWLQYLYLRLWALFGGLDEIYVLRDDIL
ncbi:hypothetical protein D9619_013656 [Psilocybe cf. subviscida]|uniref:Nephrocystin 3-like N-terminal domain-containing protein n=1 Tax=Psilocybe cf. subviscida TaxID=2480587 RepID=A0A8H5BT33_9AGAR|nr:hypothetical protein D9619_013656 [Psilocybe cf. subviscida]